MDENVFQVVKEGEFYFYKWSKSPTINVTRQEVNENNFMDVIDCDCFTNYLCLDLFDLKAAAKEYLYEMYLDEKEEQLKKLKKKFDIIFNLDIKNKRYFFSGSIANLCFSSEIKDIKLYQERGVDPTIFIDLNNNVSIIIQENCEMEIDLYSKSPIIKNRIILYNRDGVYMGYIREI